MEKDEEKVDLVIYVTENHLEYDRLLAGELISHDIKDMMRYYRATKDYAVAVTCIDEGPGLHLIISVVPKHIGVLAGEEYYKQNRLVSVQRIAILQTESLPTISPLREEDESGPGIFQHKERLMMGDSINTW